MANTYDRGDTVRCIATFVASGQVPNDPASVWFFIRNPLGSIATYVYPASIGRSGVGAYYVDVVPSVGPRSDGTWSYRFEGTNLQAAGETAFIIRRSDFL